MMKVLVVGAGLAGCTTALELAENNVTVTLIDTAASIGGKVRHYGCKATDKCNNCGLCLAAGLWEKVDQHSHINMRLSTRLVDLSQENEKYAATLKHTAGVVSENFNKVIISIGFLDSATAEKSGQSRIISGSQIEMLLRDRTSTGFLETSPESVAFVMCHGSRDCHEHTMYCSRVCCKYATRTAKAIKHFYPECRIVFFYMEMQMVAPGDYYQSLLDLGIEFIKCRPVEVNSNGSSAAHIVYDDPVSGKRLQDCFDLVVLSEGIKPNSQSRQVSEICELGQDKAGFLQYVNTNNPDIKLVGCASGPKDITETYAEAIAAAKEILQSQEALI
ncbi:MAG: FAD-dependent oxidoreductase [Defluviitaleaceae bacterium]|nr:FAD-dependent oxidoreductase [Defluviitaleaceae bacterium]